MSKKPTKTAPIPFTGEVVSLVQASADQQLYRLVTLKIVDGQVVSQSFESQEEYPGLIIPKSETILWTIFHNLRDNKSTDE